MMTNNNKIRFTEVDDDGLETEHELPSKWEICYECRGNGTHVNPNIDGHGISSDEWNGPDWDEESRETYMNGGYDVTCGECGGRGRVLVVDENTCDEKLLEKYRDFQEEEYCYRREREQERKMGA